MGGREPLGVRPPTFVSQQPEQAERALEALCALYRDFLEHALDSRGEKSVDIDEPAAGPPPNERRFE